MESTYPGVLMYLLIAWGIVTAVFVGLLWWQSILSNREEDELYIDKALEHMAIENQKIIAKITKLSRPITTTGIASAVLLLTIAGVWLYSGLKNF